MACSSRNPQNCLAGANDYRTVDLPVPDIGERITGDAWLGWYTTKDGGLTWRTRLLPGFPQDTSDAGKASPLRGYAAGADPIIRPGTNGLFYYGGLVFNREEGGGAEVFVARFIDNNNQEGVGGETDRISRRLGGAAGRPAAFSAGPQIGGVRVDGCDSGRAASRGRAGAQGARRQNVRRVAAGAVQSGGEQTGGQALDGRQTFRVPARRCARLADRGRALPLQTFPGGRVYMAYALFEGANEERGRIMFSRSLDCGVTWSPPRTLSRVRARTSMMMASHDRGCSKLHGQLGRSCGQPRYNPNADINTDCVISSSDLALCRPRRQSSGAEAAAPLARRDARRRSANRRIADRLATIQGRRAPRRHRHGSQLRRRR